MRKTLADVLRLQAWERAKGELSAVIHTYDEGLPCGDVRYKHMVETIGRFVAEVEDDGWLK